MVASWIAYAGLYLVFVQKNALSFVFRITLRAFLSIVIMVVNYILYADMLANAQHGRRRVDGF